MLILGQIQRHRWIEPQQAEHQYERHHQEVHSEGREQSWTCSHFSKDGCTSSLYFLKESILIKSESCFPGIGCLFNPELVQQFLRNPKDMVGLKCFSDICPFSQQNPVLSTLKRKSTINNAISYVLMLFLLHNHISLPGCLLTKSERSYKSSWILQNSPQSSSIT